MPIHMIEFDDATLFKTRESLVVDPVRSGTPPNTSLSLPSASARFKQP
ncbi:hypothetical protein RRSWK_04407 [Rhodopirellula sp. SWK7]|nr:hypothetical protein RRSWK_04407 [Rhodopirellula sp. SWK7]